MTDRLSGRDPGTLVDAWLEEGPRELAYPVRESIRQNLHGMPQRQARSWPLLGRRAVIASSFVTAALVAVVLIASLVGRPAEPAGSPTPLPEPGREHASNFANGDAAFSYVVPPGSGIDTTDTSWNFYQFAGPAENDFVRVRLIREGFTDPCDSASPPQQLTSADAVTTYLTSIPELHATVEPVTEVDGREATVVDTRVMRDAACPEVFLWYEPIPVRAPDDELELRFLLMDVSGSVVAIAIQSDDLERWLPPAMSLVRSIRFENPGP